MTEATAEIWESYEAMSSFVVATMPTADKERRRITEVPCGPMRDGKCPGYEQAEADARLIAAAPEMHAALVALIRTDDLQMAIDLARSALAKAEPA